MARRRLILLIVSVAAGGTALAQNARSGVSLLGSDANPCTVALPCRSFGVALSQTLAGGEIVALTTAGYGPFTIDRAITVSGAPGVHAALSVAAGAGISVAAAGADRIVLRNLIFIGSGGTTGIDIVSGAETRVIDCLIHRFTTGGIVISGTGNLSVERCTVVENGQVGISVGSNTFATAHGMISDSLIGGNFYGVAAQQYGAVVLVGSRITGNSTGAAAISLGGSGGAPADLMLEHCTIVNSSDSGVNAITDANNAARVTISANVFSFNAIAVNSTVNGTVTSFRNNRFMRNAVDGTFGTTLFK
jgi:hypothetical protein